MGHSFIMAFRRLFPFGYKLFDRTATPEPAKEFALLATDFAVIKGLLIGVAGGHKEAFSTEHVVQTVRTAFKHFEHDYEFLVKAHQILVNLKLDNAHGLTMLLRNCYRDRGGQTGSNSENAPMTNKREAKSELVTMLLRRTQREGTIQTERLAGA
jgi:hypothetical protein